MKLYAFNLGVPKIGLPPKILLIMKLVVVILICSFMQVSAATFGQQLTFSSKNVTLKTLFKEIRKQTGYEVIYADKALNDEQKITADFNGTPLTQVLDVSLKGLPVTYVIDDKGIVIKEKEPSFLDQVVTAFNAIDVHGRVVDEKGLPLPGVTVKVKDGSLATTTDKDGYFLLKKVNEESVIIFSYIGFLTKEINAATDLGIISLEASNSKLDEIQVIAYGQTSKRLQTGNVSSINSSELEKQPVSNPLLALQGQMTGVVVQQATGLFNSGVTIHIQGLNSLRSGTDPFFVIDGVPYVSQLLPIANGSAGGSGSSGITGNPLNFLNMEDIESIVILKDADATAIYGSRAANGAVLITTKKGKSGKPKVDINSQTGWSQVGHMINVLNTKQYLEMRHEALRNDGITTPSSEDFDLNGTWDTTRNINWQKRLIGNTAKYTDVQANVSGGDTLTQFLVGAGYKRQTSVFPGNFADSKASAHFSLNNSSSNEKFKFSLSASYMYDDNRPPILDLTTSAIMLAPMAPEPYNPDGSLNWQPTASGSTSYYSNPLAPQAATNVNKTNNLVSNSVISYDIIPGVTLKSNLGYTNLTQNETFLQPLSTYYPELRQYLSRFSTFFYNRINSWIIEPQLEFKRNISRGKYDLLLGGTITQNNSDQSAITAVGFNNDLVMSDLGSATNVTGSNINAIYKYNAIFSRMTYNWDDKYVVNLNARRDGSSRFGPKNQFHNFGSIGAIWIFSEESFLKNSLPFISFGKLRGSYGTTGNDQIGDYQFLSLYQPITVPGTLFQNTVGLAPNRLTNPYLQWEETKKLQFGLDLGFMRDKILLTVNYNRNRSSNQLFTYGLPIITGFRSITKNFPALIQNTGWEFTLNSSNISTKQFSWKSSINLTIPQNKLLSFNGVDNYGVIVLGKSITAKKIFQYTGINDATGAYEFKDSKGNITNSPSDPADRIAVASPDPKFYGGIQNSISYKGFSLDFLFTFFKQSAPDYLTYGMQGLYSPGSFNYGLGNQSTLVLNRWQNPGGHPSVAPFSSNPVDLSFISNSSAGWIDASYIKLKNISLYWKFPYRFTKSAHLQNLKIYVQAQNLLTITNYNGFDPESPGLSLPPLKTIVFGAQISL